MRTRVGTALVVALLLTGCGSALTREHLSPSFNTVFTQTYVRQQHLLGRHPLAPGQLQALSSCRRTGTSATGPGEDWQCLVTYLDVKKPAAQAFEVQLKSDGCWKANGSPTTQPAQLQAAVSGAPLTNPLSEFDGCLDTSS